MWKAVEWIIKTPLAIRNVLNFTHIFINGFLKKIDCSHAHIR